MIGIKGYDVPKARFPPANLVFLIDTSGSMQDRRQAAAGEGRACASW
jgi:Mg-chelatase subunit ChlD